jgi:hypothetical protein
MNNQPCYIAAIAARLDDANAVWQSIGLFTSKQAATAACYAMDAIPHDAFTVLPTNSHSPMLEVVASRKPIATFYIRKDTFLCDTEDYQAGEVWYIPFVLPPHLLKTDTHELSPEYAMLKPCATREEAIAAARAFCDQYGWQPLHEHGKTPAAQQVLQAILAK